MKFLVRIALSLLALLTAAAPAAAQLTKDNVLMIVNLNSEDSKALRNAYRAKYGSDVRAWEYSGPTDVTITRAQFQSTIRVPLDAYLKDLLVSDPPLHKQIRILLTTKGVPRRIYDTGANPNVGDSGTAALGYYSNGAYTAAAVDSELVLVHQDLQSGAAPLPANYANNFIRNPYHNSPDRIMTHGRDNATEAKLFNYNFNNNGWENVSRRPRDPVPSTELTPGDLYLVCRLDGYTLAEALAALDRAGTVTVNKNAVTTILDRDARAVQLDHDDLYSLGPDFPRTRNTLLAAGFNVDYDETAAFLASSTRSIIGYSSYGVHHQPSPGRFYILKTLYPNLNLAPGAIFNSYESYNARNFETLDPHDAVQGQVADWIHIGGTLGVGHAYEPLTAFIADNEVIYQRMLVQGWTFAEAAYASLPGLSWQNVVVGDPLTTFTVVALPYGTVTGWQVLADHGPAGTIATSVADGYVECRHHGLRTVRVTFSKAVNPATALPSAISLTGQVGGDMSSLVQSVQLDAGGTQLTIQFSQPLPDADRYVLAIRLALKDVDGQSYASDVALVISQLTGDIDAGATVTVADLLAARAKAGQSVTAGTVRYDLDRSGQINGHDLRLVRTNLGHLLLP